jgi:hypothetical protein
MQLGQVRSTRSPSGSRWISTLALVGLALAPLHEAVLLARVTSATTPCGLACSRSASSPTVANVRPG